MNYSESINGLQMTLDQIKTISNNIANSATNGFKSNKIYSKDIITETDQNNNEKHGLGAIQSRIHSNYLPGDIKKTGKNLDFFINQDGFFRLEDIDGSIYYTRNGEFYIDNKNNLVNMNGMYLTGYLTIDEKFKKEPEIINLNKFSIMPAKQTTSVNVSASLNKSEPIIKQNLQINKSNTYNHKNDMIIFDNKSQMHIIRLYWKKIFPTAWDVYFFDETVKNKQIAKCTVEYNTDITSIASNNFVGKILEYNGSKESNFEIKFDNFTQNNKASEFDLTQQNGCRSGALYSYTVLENGNIIGKYSNQKNNIVGKISINKFANLDALIKTKDNLWKIDKNFYSNNSNITEENDLHSLTIGALETSNVNINNELIDLISAQKNYQAIIQSIKIKDKMIGTLINNLS
ncbi:Flagellar hook protein FlgE [Buchnera aphidicola (Eriosoma grossulariae)]|uniref:flagellar hook-basal body complex protein n=1 Tax=Buchnera aphidicola TaxID=9 RepID=UPI003463EA67